MLKETSFHGSLHCTLKEPPQLSKAASCVTETAYQNKTSLPYSSPKLENISFVKFSNYFGIYYLICNLNIIFVEYLSKNWDMISILSRSGCMLYFVNSRLARGLNNHLQCVILVRCYQHIVNAVVVVHDLRESAEFAFELTTLEFPKYWVVRGNLHIKASISSFHAVICPG